MNLYWIKQLTSTILFFVAKKLPGARDSSLLLGRLRRVSDAQERLALKAAQSRSAPAGGMVKLTSMSIVVTFEPENFDSLVKAVTKGFRGNPRVSRFIDDFNKVRGSILSSSVTRLPIVGHDASKTLSNWATSDKSLPNVVKHVEVWFYRILPSLAALSFEFTFTEEVSSQIEDLLSQPIVEPIVVDFFPLFNGTIRNSFHYRGSCVSLRTEAILNDVGDMCWEWLKRSFGLNIKAQMSHQYNFNYSVSRSKDDQTDLNRWQQDNRDWLNSYLIETTEREVYESYENIRWNRYNLESQTKTFFIVTSFANGNVESESYESLSFNAYSALVSKLDSYRSMTERIGSNGHLDKVHSSFRYKARAKYVQSLKILIARVLRMDHELRVTEIRRNHHLVALSSYRIISASGSGHNSDLLADGSVYVTSTIDRLLQALKVLDAGMSESLTIHNMLVIYRLQLATIAFAAVAIAVTVWSEEIAQLIVKVLKITFALVARLLT
ncbi:MAG: hypothetical protein HYX66_00010 [Ignavibacteria bacterium]|nr:hypothetical protein [Ignavibacteria bacterium]